MKKTYARPGLLLAGTSLLLMTAQADVTLPALLSHHAVLQQSDHTRIWGKAGPGETVSVTLGGLHAQTVAGSDGKWQLSVDVTRLGPGPFELIVAGRNRVVVKDVLIGEVWVCSGQSNMAFGLGRAGEAAQEIPRASHPQLRQFRVANVGAEKPEDDCKGAWLVARPDTAQEFSAVGYFFGASYATLSSVIGYAGWIVAAGVAIFIVLYFLLLRFTKNVFLKQT